MEQTKLGPAVYEILRCLDFKALVAVTTGAFFMFSCSLIGSLFHLLQKHGTRIYGTYVPRIDCLPSLFKQLEGRN